MRWWMNASMKWTLAHMPGGGWMYGRLQERYGELAQLESSTRFDNAEQFARTARRWCGELGDLRVVELGTGWVPALPLALLAAGARVDAYDVVPLCPPRLFQRTRDELNRRTERIATAAGIAEESVAARLAEIASAPNLSAACLEMGGSYRAPFDTCRLPYTDGEADLVVSNLVLQCIPHQVLPTVLAESFRVLRPGGIAIHRVRMTDEYAAGDPQRNHLEYLSYSRRVWNRWFNNPLKHQNRLRASQFLTLFAEAGFDCRSEERDVDEESVPVIQEMSLAAEFRELDPRDVAAVNLDVVLQKPVRTAAGRRREPAPTQETTRDV